MVRIHVVPISEPASESRRELSINPDLVGTHTHPAIDRIEPTGYALCGNDRMIELPGGVEEAGRDVLSLKVRIVLKDLVA